MPSLFDPNLKLQWAKKHLDLLGERISIFKKANKCVLSTYEDLENGWYVIRTTFPDDPAQFVIALTAGDFIVTLRSSLDHLIWQLALFGGDTPGRDTCFPVCEKESLDTQVRIIKSTYGIPDGAISVVKALQPYHSGDNYKSTHLWRLNQLWNIDKHRHIAHHGVLSGWQFKTPGGHPVECIEVDNGCEMRIPLAFKDKVELNPNIGEVDFFFGDRSEGLSMDHAGLVEMYEFIAAKVFPAFASFFPQ